MDLDYRTEKIEDLLKQKKYKLTYARREIINLFVKNTNKHFKADEVYNLVKDKNISLPTVYRTIEILKNNGIIKETVIDKTRYYELEIFSKKSLHLHLKCTRCGNVIDFVSTKSILMLLDEKNSIEKLYKFKIDDIYAILQGECEKCRR